MKKEILIIDSTLRDGSHAISHQLSAKNIADYSVAAELAGIKILVVGHGNGLGASSLHLGTSAIPDGEMLKTAKKYLKKTKLSAFLIPGFGTIKDNLAPALAIGIRALMVASHCTEANVTRQHIEFAVKNNLETYGILMMSHMISATELLEQARLMESFGATGVILMDSAGAYLPEDVKRKVSALVSGLKIDVGFHAHNNLGLAIANSLMAVQNGATIVDTTSRGFGAGAGNCQMEVLVAVLQKLGYETNLNLYKLMDISEEIVSGFMTHSQEINKMTLSSGLAGVFSGFAPHAQKAAEKYGVDVRDIFMELGKRHIVAGQEDAIIDVAMNLKQNKEKTAENFQIESLT